MRSEVYDFLNPHVELTDEQKRSMEHNLASVLVHFHMEAIRLVKLFLFLSHLASVGLILYFIVELATQELPGPPRGMAIAFVVLESLAKIEILAVMVICVAMPFVLMVLCCCMCCCGRRFGQTQMPEMPSVKYTANIQLECEPECRICFQNFYPEEDIMILPCNNKHAFHKGCIENWFKMSTKCPMCRKDLSVRSGIGDLQLQGD